MQNIPRTITGELNYFLSQTKNNRNKNKNEEAQNVDKQNNDKNLLSKIKNCASCCSLVCYLNISFFIILSILVFTSILFKNFISKKHIPRKT
jgi:hypothetical protein